MKPFHTDKCPLCQKLLKREYTPGYNLYECQRHYFLSERSTDHWPIYSRIYLPDFLLTYDLTDTAIFKFDSLTKDGVKITLSSYKYVCTLNGHLELDWTNLKTMSNRLNKLLAFS